MGLKEEQSEEFFGSINEKKRILVAVYDGGEFANYLQTMLHGDACKRIELGYIVLDVLRTRGRRTNRRYRKSKSIILTRQSGRTEPERNLEFASAPSTTNSVKEKKRKESKERNSYPRRSRITRTSTGSMDLELQIKIFSNRPAKCAPRLADFDLSKRGAGFGNGERGLK